MSGGGMCQALGGCGSLGEACWAVAGSDRWSLDNAGLDPWVVLPDRRL